MFHKSLALALVMCLLTSFVDAQESSKSWWNWGSDKEPSRSSTFFGSSSKSKPSMTSMFKLPSWSKSKSKSGSKSSTYSKMTRTSKRWWDNTTDFLNPFNDGKPKTTTPQNSWQSRNKPVEKKKGWFDWMTVEDKKEDRIETIGDWLRQPPVTP